MPQKNHEKCLLSICDISPTKLGSFEEFLINLSKKVLEQGFEHVIIFREKPIECVEDALVRLGVKIRIIKPSKYNAYNLLNFYKIIKEIKPLIVHFHFYPIYTVVNFLRAFLDIKIIYTDHMGGKEAKSSFRKMLRKIYYYTNSKLFSFGIEEIICVSNFTKKKYTKEYGIHPKNTRVIYNGINTDRFYKRSDITRIKDKYKIKDEYIITCVGLRKDKGAHCLVKAIQPIIKHIPNTKILFVGEGECRNYLESKIITEGLKNYFLFTGSISDIEEVYSISSLVVMPTLVEEACPFTALESMAVGVPVVAFDSGGTKEVVIDGQTGCILPRNSKLLAEKVISLYENGNLSSMGEKGTKRVNEYFSMDICTDNYMHLYNELVNKKFR
jgi:L-malate glycosyltransferase